jgi:hypothetical protein
MVRRRRDLADPEAVDDLPGALAELRAVTGEEAIELRARLRAIENRLERLEQVEERLGEATGATPGRKRASGRRTDAKKGLGRKAAAARKPKADARAQKDPAKRRRDTRKRQRADSPDTERSR